MLAVIAASASVQSGYPRKPILMLVPLQAAIVVENQPGAAGLIGAEKVARATQRPSFWAHAH